MRVAPQVSCHRWMEAQRRPEEDHPLQGEFMEAFKEYAEANSSQEVAFYFLAQAKRYAIMAKEAAADFPEVRVVETKMEAAERKRARKLERLAQQLPQVESGE